MNLSPPPDAAPAPPPKFLRVATVLERVGCGKSHLYKLIRKGQFPAPIRYSPGFVVWPEGEVDAWIEDKLAAPH